MRSITTLTRNLPGLGRFKYFDRTRDTIFVHECKTGHESKYCNDCTGLDAIGCGSTYLMFRSSCGCGSDSEADPGTSTDNCPDCRGTSCSGACGCTCPECIDNQHYGSCKCGAPECPVCKGSTCGGDCGCSKEPKRRVKFHHHCGSVQVFDDDGTILIENYVLQETRRFPKGTSNGILLARSKSTATITRMKGRRSRFILLMTLISALSFGT
jgi:hypothetical protein